MPVRPNVLERLLLFRLNEGPAPILDLFGAGAFRAVALAIDLGLFEALDGSDRPLSATALADSVGAHPDGLRPLLRLLAATGYVESGSAGYELTGTTERWLTTGSETNMAPWFAFWDELVFPFWTEHLETTVREGEPPRSMYEWFDERPERWELAQRGFRAAATVLVDEIASKLTVPDDARTLLDVGGGHGLYAVELCSRHPNLRATVFDAPAALTVAREEIAATDFADRLRVRAGDYETDALGERYDVALLFNVLHAHDAPECRALFERVAASLGPGGRIAVLDQFADAGGSSLGQTGVGFVGLTYRVTLGADVHAYEDVRTWLEQSGFEAVTEKTVRRGGPGNSLVEARLPS
ncbi:class I SAM-dependent methyltransferase [Haloarcula nitratireducens]|uniref:Methyltransferase n=1 Tax=Haloarcula nitratireducens TaxID=2487749 RepID=A0AAW4P8V5_9EURY|nr:class I SAM-dependent methyltransferase [Halomicroarcula nitratireducens]MBX0294187.1 methyltransferase [Halomicroarcula nitratireducens]